MARIICFVESEVVNFTSVIITENSWVYQTVKNFKNFSRSMLALLYQFIDLDPSV